MGTYLNENTSLIRYSDENSLACVVTLALYTARKRYLAFRELPSGNGYAGINYATDPRNPAYNHHTCLIEKLCQSPCRSALDN